MVLSTGNMTNSRTSKSSNSNSFPNDNQANNAIFTAGLDDVTSMNKILHELHHTDEQSIMMISCDGLRFITAGEKSFQVSAFFAASVFQRFKADVEPVHFRFMLKDLIELLNLLRDDAGVETDKINPDEQQATQLMKTSLFIQYMKRGDPLRLRLENNSNYVINCDLKAFNVPNDQMLEPMSLATAEDTAVILLNSKRFYEYVSGFDLITSDYVHLVMSPGDTPLKLDTKSSALGQVELEITSNERDIIKRDIVVSDNQLFSFNYKTQFMRPALEALRASSLVQIKCGSNGVLCIEHFHSQLDNKHGPREDFLPGDSESNQATNKRSSVEYFILSEAKAVDGDW